ncbi:MAG: gamma-glutamylcyclotransferase [Betaproteobacteria bacterium]
MTDLVFFYGTLMSGFRRSGRERIDSKLQPEGRGWIRAALFDLGIYPAAVPAPDSRVWGEVHRMTDRDAVLAELDDIEGYRPGEPDASLYVRVETQVTFADGRSADAWAYFYNAPLGRAQRIESGDYLEHLKVKP